MLTVIHIVFLIAFVWTIVGALKLLAIVGRALARMFDRPAKPWPYRDFDW